MTKELLVFDIVFGTLFMLCLAYIVCGFYMIFIR